MSSFPPLVVYRFFFPLRWKEEKKVKNQSCPKRNEEAVLSVRVQPGGQPMMLFPARSPPSFHPLTYNAEHVRPGQSRFCSASALRRWVRRSRVRLLLPLPAAPGGPGRPAGGPPRGKCTSSPDGHRGARRQLAGPWSVSSDPKENSCTTECAAG